MFSEKLPGYTDSLWISKPWRRRGRGSLLDPSPIDVSVHIF